MNAIGQMMDSKMTSTLTASQDTNESEECWEWPSPLLARINIFRASYEDPGSWPEFEKT
jgi:hypothetical protein